MRRKSIKKQLNEVSTQLEALRKPNTIFIKYEGLIYCDKDKMSRDIYAALNKATAQPENNEVRITNEINTHLQEIERLFKELNSDHTFMISVESAKVTLNGQSDLVVLVSFTKNIDVK